MGKNKQVRTQKRIVGFLVIWLAVSMFFAVYTPTANATVTTTIALTSSTADGALMNNTGNLAANRVAPTGTVDTANDTLYAGSVVSGTADLFRAYLYFDLSTIPVGATVTSGYLSLNIIATGVPVHNMTIQTGTSNVYPHNPLVTTDFSYSYYSGSAGSLNASSISGSGYWNITLSTAGAASATAAVLAGELKLVVRCQPDIDGSFTGSSEYVKFYSADKGAGYEPTLYITYTTNAYDYQFHGVYSETTGEYLSACNVTVYFSASPAQTFELDVSRNATWSTAPLYANYDLSPYDRQYWFDPAENGTDLYVYNGATTSYVISFLDYTGILKTLPYVEAKVNVEGTYVTVDKRKVDVQSSVVMSLVEGTRYTLTIGDGSTYTYGDLLMTATTAVQLTLTGVQFPKETLLMQSTVYISAVRNFTTHTIDIIYLDTALNTTSVLLEFKYNNGSTAYSTTQISNSFTLLYAASDSETYYLTATVTHIKYGVLTYRQFFLELGTTTPPFSLAWMGALPFDTAYIFPALLILFVAGCFSALNAEVGAVLVCIMAILLTVMGWIPIPAGALVAATVFAILMALIYNRRRTQIY